MTILRDKRPKASKETVSEMVKKNIKNASFTSFFPVVNQKNKEISAWFKEKQLELALMNERQRNTYREKVGSVLIPHAEKYKKAKVIDSLTQEEIGVLYYTDTPESWVAFYSSYQVKLKGKKGEEYGEWYGCFAVNISPVDGLLGFESASGQDSRDFRGNSKAKKELTEENVKARKFGKKYSKFSLQIVK